MCFFVNKCPYSNIIFQPCQSMYQWGSSSLIAHILCIYCYCSFFNVVVKFCFEHLGCFSKKKYRPCPEKAPSLEVPKVNKCPRCQIKITKRYILCDRIFYRFFCVLANPKILDMPLSPLIFCLTFLPPLVSTFLNPLLHAVMCTVHVEDYVHCKYFVHLLSWP